MSAILFLFERKLVYSLRWGLVIVGYEARSRDLSERLYGIYLVILLSGWSVVMLSWSVVTLTSILKVLPVPLDSLHLYIFYGLAAWLAVVPWLAQRSYALFRFTLADLFFLSSTPVSSGLVAVSWFAKSHFSRLGAVFVIGSGLFASALYSLLGRNDWQGLLLGLSSALCFLVVACAWLWALGLLRYHQVPRFGVMAGYSLSAILLALLYALPAPRGLFLPAELASSLIGANYAAAEDPTPAAIALVFLAVLGSPVVYFIGRSVYFAPAFEEARLGKQVKRGAKTVTDRRVRPAAVLARRRGGFRRRGEEATGTGMEGSGPSLVRLYWLRLGRLPAIPLVMNLALPVLFGASAAVLLAGVGLVGRRLEVLAPVAFFANMGLARLGAVVLRTNLEHVDFFAGWPLTRSRLLLLSLLLGYGWPLVAGEVALLGVASAGLFSGVVPLWLLLWPVLVAASILAAFVAFLWLLRRWPATAETVPDLGAGVLLVPSLVWLVALFWVPNM